MKSRVSMMFSFVFLTAVEVLAAGAEVGTSEASTTLDLWLDESALACETTQVLHIQPGPGRLVAQCTDGRSIDCIAAPGQWVYDRQNGRLIAECRTPDPGFSIEANPQSQPTSQGGSATWQIRVRNTGVGPLSSIQVTTTPATAGCNRTFSSLAAGGMLSYSCAMVNVPGSVEVHFAATALRAGAPASAAAQAQLIVNGVPPTGPNVNMKACRDPPFQVVQPGQPATWEVRLQNIGVFAFSSIAISDSVASTCTRTLGALGPGESTVFTCSRAAAGEYQATLSVTAVTTQNHSISFDWPVRVAFDPIFDSGFDPGHLAQ